MLSAPTQIITKNGYFFVYVSNESPQDVYFDNLTVKFFSGSLLQEQSYYPFNLPMAGISDKALLKLNNVFKGNSGTELEEDFGLQYYNTASRRYDPQIGRFTGVDAFASDNPTTIPYHFGNDNPITFSDPLGGWVSNSTEYSSREFADGLQISSGWVGGWSDGNWAGGEGILPWANDNGGANSYAANAAGGGGPSSPSDWDIGNTPQTDNYLKILENLWNDGGGVWSRNSDGSDNYHYFYNNPVFVVYDPLGTPIGVVEQLIDRVMDAKNGNGIEVKFRFLDFATDYISISTLNWQQVVTTTAPNEETPYDTPFLDGLGNDKTYFFPYPTIFDFRRGGDNADLNAADLLFVDSPGRDAFTGDFCWSANLSLVTMGPNGSGPSSYLITINYGFFVSNQKVYYWTPTLILYISTAIS